MAIDKKKVKTLIGITGAAVGAAFVGMEVLAHKKKRNSVYDNESEQKNPLEGKKVVFVEDENDPENADGVRGHLEAVGDSDYHPGFYDKYGKRAMDIVLSFGGLVLLSPIYAGIALAIKIDDPGPVLFTQKRMGQNKQYFKLHKFRSMKMSTPHDVPTHMLDNPDQYITKVGKFLRAHSLDELPQIWDIFIGNMSVIGPRPGLWNQDILTAERDKYGANDVKPGLTGWAQINGRDELEIPDKAKLDGDYVQNMGLKMDAKCFLGSVHVFGKDESVVEGGTGALNEENANVEFPAIAKYKDSINAREKKKILIAGKGSYIGEAFKAYMLTFDNYEIDEISTLNDEWRNKDFSKYDVVYVVAGIAHVKETNKNRELYYKVNRDLAVSLAEKAKAESVKQFIYLSSMSVYGLVEGVIDRTTNPNPINAYGKSKLEAEQLLWKLNSDEFVVSIIRPPMVYGYGCKGNYQELRRFALKIGVFPKFDNNRSMIFIDNLSSAVRGVIHNFEPGVYFPQNHDYVNTSEMVDAIGKLNGKKIKKLYGAKFIVKFLSRKITMCKKVFGTLVYASSLNVPNEWLCVQNNLDTYKLSECCTDMNGKAGKNKKILVLMSAYNGEKYIQQQIRSIMEQTTNASVYLKIRDDGSNDNTCDVIKSMQLQYGERIELVLGENKGYNASFFELINSSNGFDYYAISDQDDVWLNNKIQTAIEFLEKENTDIPLLYASTSFLVNDDLIPYGTTRKKEREFTLYNTIIQNICPGHTQVMNDALLQLLKNDIDTKKIYVYDSWITNIAMLYGKILFDNNAHTYYRQHKENQLGSGNGTIGQLLSSSRRISSGDGFKYKDQIKYFVEVNKEELIRQNEYQEIHRFLSVNSYRDRIKYFANGKLYRQKKIETLMFYLAVILNKY